jgi:hypothetical protein
MQARLSKCTNLEESDLIRFVGANLVFALPEGNHKDCPYGKTGGVITVAGT